MVGETFLSDEKKTNSGIKRHLYIIVAEKDNDFLAVPVTTFYPNTKYCNPECILNKGDHPFIKHQSWVDFSKALSYSYTDLHIHYSNHEFIKKEPLKKEILDFVIAHAETSEDLPEKFLAFFE